MFFLFLNKVIMITFIFWPLFLGHLLDRRQWTMAHIKGIQPERLYIITMVLIPRPSGRHINDILIYSI